MKTCIAAAATTAAATLLLAAGPAAADGGYLHMSEANILAYHLAAKFEHSASGIYTQRDCVRTSSRSATCEIDRLLKLEGVRCVYQAHVAKRYAHGRYAWTAVAGRGDCQMIA